MADNKSCSSFAYSCDVCSVKMNSLFQLREHEKGKRHLVAFEHEHAHAAERAAHEFALEPRKLAAVFAFLWISLVIYFYAFFVLAQNYGF